MTAGRERVRVRSSAICAEHPRHVADRVPGLAATEAVYHPLSDRRSGVGITPAGHFAATLARSAETSGPILVQNP
jgi:hypothetical protein